jgi:inorganic triphosphatase YgiF
MFQETEIKLRVSSETASAIKEHPLLKRRQVGCWRSGVIYNQYFDTPDKRLASAGVALRMRKDGEQYIQTLKYNAFSIAGMSVRREWDWYLDAPDLDTGVLDESCWPDTLKAVDKCQLGPIFRTDFRRTRALIRWQRDHECVEVEAAIDEGFIETADASEIICELELELRKGPDIVVLELARCLAEDTALMPCDLSKSERGYQLLAHAVPFGERMLPQWSATVKVPTAAKDIGRALLADLVSLSEHLYTSFDWGSFCKLHRKLGKLHQYFQIFHCDIPKAVRKELFEHSDSFFRDNRMDVFVSLNENDRYDHAVEIFNSWIKSHRWGLLLIGFGQWLLSEEPAESEQHIKSCEGDTDHVLTSWLKKEIDRTKDVVLKPYDNRPATEKLIKYGLQSRPLPSRLSFIFDWFWSFLEIERPSSLLRELEELEFCADRFPLDADREREILERSLRELQLWDGKLTNKIHQYVF